MSLTKSKLSILTVLRLVVALFSPCRKGESEVKSGHMAGNARATSALSREPPPTASVLGAHSGTPSGTTVLQPPSAF